MNTKDKAMLLDLLDDFAEAHHELADAEHEVGTTRYLTRVRYASSVRSLIVEFVESLTKPGMADDPHAGLRTCEVGPLDEPVQG